MKGVIMEIEEKNNETRLYPQLDYTITDPQ